MTTKELKPCPFCGGKESYMEIRCDAEPRVDGAYNYCVTLGCFVCGVRVDIRFSHQSNTDSLGSRCKAIEIWNTRPIEAGLEARVKELEEMCGKLRALAEDRMSYKALSERYWEEIQKLDTDIYNARAAAVQWVTYDVTVRRKPCLL